MKRQTICPDCGGIASITGTEDDYEVICNHCDPRGPVVKRRGNASGDTGEAH